MRDKLAMALISYYGPAQMRGRHCQVVDYQRTGGFYYFFAYLDDYPDILRHNPVDALEIKDRSSGIGEAGALRGEGVSDVFKV